MFFQKTPPSETPPGGTSSSIRIFLQPQRKRLRLTRQAGAREGEPDGRVLFYPAQERLLRSANRADRCEALDCPVGSPYLSVGKRDKIRAKTSPHELILDMGFPADWQTRAWVQPASI